MIVRKIYYGTVPIRRVYLGGKIVWAYVQHVYARGSALGVLETDAGPYTAVAELTAGRAEGAFWSRASPVAELVAPVLMLCAGEGDGRAGGDSIPTVRARASASGEGSGYASAVTYGIVYGAGAAGGVADIRGSPLAAEVTPSSGTAGGTVTGRAGAQPQEPEQIRMSAGGTATGAAGAVLAEGERAAGHASGTMTAMQAGAIASFKEGSPLVLLTAEEEDTVFLWVDGVDYPLKNVSDPEPSGEEDTYIMEIT